MIRAATFCGMLSFCLLTLFTFVPATISADGQQTLGLSETAVKIRDEVSVGGMRKDIARLSSLSTRVTGYDEAANGAKYVFDRFVEIGLQNIEARGFEITVPIDAEDGKLEVLSSDGTVIKSVKISPCWPNLVRTSLLPNGIKHFVDSDETLEEIAESYQVDVQSILANPNNQYLLDQATDGRDNDSDGDIDEAGEFALIEGNTVFVPTGGLTAPLLYAGDAELVDFNGLDVGGFWYDVQPGDTLENVSRRFRVSRGSVTDDVLNGHLQKTEDGIDNDEDTEVDE
ncbi:MAG: LysM peptidoglycan-binding domain-containing protein, partial [Candidatus Poribacteria bacterium]|nr:LysM peptidoglycan-binding domain-containing protein [Candidatus Poribacteria bacterium]